LLQCLSPNIEPKNGGFLVIDLAKIVQEIVKLERTINAIHT
jgi:hypothetical protein